MVARVAFPSDRAPAWRISDESRAKRLHAFVAFGLLIAALLILAATRRLRPAGGRPDRDGYGFREGVAERVGPLRIVSAPA